MTIDLKQSFDHRVSLAQCGIQRGRIFAAGLGQVRSPAAFAANFLGDRRDDFTSLNSRCQILGDPDNQRNVPIRRRPQNHHA